jgi:4-alpha-glucanotransferase
MVTISQHNLSQVRQRAKHRSVNDPVRASGVQLHITSLPGGTLGPEAYRFVDWLADAGQRWWQVLPLGPPDRYGSPYKSSSAFAAWPGLLADRRAPVPAAELLDFRERHAFWLPSWERYSARGAVLDQVRFEREWSALRAYASQRGVRLFGDIAIYVSPGGADERFWPELFIDDRVAGAPPDAYSDVGQLWGNPLYDWPALHRRRYRWWVERIRRTLSLFDMARLDHFRGLVSYWSVPKGARTAVDGTWQRGPGLGLFRAIERSLGVGDGVGSDWSGPLSLPLVAEDLGVITEPVERLRRSLGMPGMLVIQFGLDPDEPDSPHRLENHMPDRIVYTATHDQDTTRGWLESIPAAQRAFVDAELARHGFADPGEPWWGLIRLAFSSPARVAIVQAQDVLGLGSEARMNLPGSAAGSWRWRMAPGALTPALGAQLREATAEAGRLAG